MSIELTPSSNSEVSLGSPYANADLSDPIIQKRAEAFEAAARINCASPKERREADYEDLTIKLKKASRAVAKNNLNLVRINE